MGLAEFDQVADPDLGTGRGKLRVDRDQSLPGPGEVTPKPVRPRNLGVQNEGVIADGGLERGPETLLARFRIVEVPEGGNINSHGKPRPREPANQLRWGQDALAIVEESRQPAARKWEASLRHNIGYALHQLGRYDEALAQFDSALVLRRKADNDEATRVAQWMVAWTLRALGRTDEALDAQRALEKACEAAGAPDPYVFEELETLYRAKGDTERADHYAARRKALADASTLADGSHS